MPLFEFYEKVCFRENLRMTPWSYVFTGQGGRGWEPFAGGRRRAEASVAVEMSRAEENGQTSQDILPPCDSSALSFQQALCSLRAQL